LVALVTRLPGGLLHGEASLSTSGIGLGGAAECSDSQAASDMQRYDRRKGESSLIQNKKLLKFKLYRLYNPP
jgi:hypothetical protein